MEKRKPRVLPVHLPLEGMVKLPVGALSIGNWVRELCGDVVVWDMRLWSGAVNGGMLRNLVGWADWVGVSVMTEQIPEFLAFVEWGGERLKGKLVVGGVHAALFPEQFFPYTERVCSGAGEPYVAELMGLGAGWDGRWLRMEWLDQVRDYGIVNALTYRNLGHTLFGPIAGPGHLSIETARGCGNRCAFCVNTVLPWGRPWRARPEAVVLEEVGQMAKQYGVERLTFDDEHFWMDGDRALRIVDGARRIIGDRFKCGGSVAVREVLRRKAELTEAVRCGLCCVAVGMESGDDEVLRAIRKPHTVAEAKEAAAVLNELGVYGIYSFIDGLPGTGPEVDEKTRGLMDEIRRIHPNSRSSPPGWVAQRYRPYPRTELAERAGIEFPKTLTEWVA